MPLKLLQIGASVEPHQPNVLPVVIGRSDAVDIRVDCRWASRRHCEIDHIDGSFVLRDLGSRHGTIVNGETVHQITLNPGDEIGVGLHRFIVQWNDDQRSMEGESFTRASSQIANCDRNASLA